MKNAVGREIPDFLLKDGKEVYQGKNYMDGTGSIFKRLPPKQNAMKSPRRAKSWILWRMRSRRAARRAA